LLSNTELLYIKKFRFP